MSSLIAPVIDLEFDRKAFQRLKEEIEDEGDELALQVIIFGEFKSSDATDEIEEKILGIASVQLWYMIDNSCAIVLQVRFGITF